MGGASPPNGDIKMKKTEILGLIAKILARVRAEEAKKIPDWYLEGDVIALKKWQEKSKAEALFDVKILMGHYQSAKD
jgi:hypothetical protein